MGAFSFYRTLVHFVPWMCLLELPKWWINYVPYSFCLKYICREYSGILFLYNILLMSLQKNREQLVPLKACLFVDCLTEIAMFVTLKDRTDVGGVPGSFLSM